MDEIKATSELVQLLITFKLDGMNLEAANSYGKTWQVVRELNG